MADDADLDMLRRAYGPSEQELYGTGYRDPRLDMDAADSDTRNVKNVMGAREAAKQNELAQSLTNLATTAAVPYMALHRAAGNLPKAWERHVSQERKEGNPFLGPIGYPLNAGVQAGGLGFALHDLAQGNWATALPGLIGPLTTASMMTPHIQSTARILQHLNRTEPKTTTLYAGGGVASKEGPSDYMGNLEAGEPMPASASGGWDEPPPPPPRAPAFDLGAYLKGLPGRAMLEWGEKGRQMRDQPIKESARDTYGIGHFVNAEDARKEGRYLAAAGNAGLGALDLAAPITSPVVEGANLALKGWNAARLARPAQVATQAEQELKRIMLLNKVKNPKPGSAAQQNRVERAKLLAERAIPEAATPGGVSAAEAQRMFDVASRKWPGNVLAGTMAAGAASGVPGVVLDDAASHLNPMRQMFEEDKPEPRAPFQAGTEPEVAHYQKQIDQARHERNVHAGLAAGAFPAGAGTAYSTIKSAGWALPRVLPGLELAMMGGMLHPALAIPGLAMAAAPLALPAGLGAATWGLANVPPIQIDQAQKKHAYAKLIQHIQDQYRDQPKPPSLTPDQAY